MNIDKNQLVKSCRRLESGLRFGPEGVRACQFGAIASPIYWDGDEASQLMISKEMIIEKRRALFEMLNDSNSEISCKHCDMVENKYFKDVDFTRLGQIDLAAMTLCNLRCNFCGFTQNNQFIKAKYDALAILKGFDPADVQWDSVVDFNGGEPVLLKDLEAYFDYFKSMRIRNRFMTNSAIYDQHVYDGLLDGTLQWVVTSIDAGTPSTYAMKKKRNKYEQVLENLTRYAHAGRQGGGRLAIKYIFCDDNCGDDDIVGFAYAVLAIKPHQVWLTFDFSNFGKAYDYAVEIKAYAKLWLLLKKHGVEPVHYSIGHLALISQEGKTLLDSVVQEINRLDTSEKLESLDLSNHAEKALEKSPNISRFSANPLRLLSISGKVEPFSLQGKSILITPPCKQSIDLLTELTDSSILGFLDRDRMIQGKNIEGISIYGYDNIQALKPDVIIVAAPEQHREDIADQLSGYLNSTTPVFVMQ